MFRSYREDEARLFGLIDEIQASRKRYERLKKRAESESALVDILDPEDMRKIRRLRTTTYFLNTHRRWQKAPLWLDHHMQLENEYLRGHADGQKFQADYRRQQLPATRPCWQFWKGNE